jgi:hypothetical protein
MHIGAQAPQREYEIQSVVNEIPAVTLPLMRYENTSTTLRCLVGSDVKSIANTPWLRSSNESENNAIPSAHNALEPRSDIVIPNEPSLTGIVTG